MVLVYTSLEALNEALPRQAIVEIALRHDCAAISVNCLVACLTQHIILSTFSWHDLFTFDSV